MKDTMKDSIFCSSCDYAISKLSRDRMWANPSTVLCPCCDNVTLDTFYSYGSKTHRDRRERWEAGLFAGNPPPLPVEPTKGEA